MNSHETSGFCAAMATVWPTFEVSTERVKILALLLRDIELSDAMIAMEVLANTYDGEFAPSIPTIMKTIRKVTEAPAERLGAEEAFGLVQQAVSRFGYYQEAAALKSLPPKAAIAAKALGWNNICMTEHDDLGTLRAHFYRTFNAVTERVKDEKFIPDARQQRIENSEIAGLINGATRSLD